MTFFDKLEKRINSHNTILCLGLDPRAEEVEKFSKSPHFDQLYTEKFEYQPNESKFDKDSTYVKLKLYCLHILKNTLDHVCCVKPNLAFFLSYTTSGLQVLEEICKYLRGLNVPVLLDCKIGDIGSTTEYYRKFIFDQLRADACTVNPLLGSDVLKSLCSNSDNELVNDLFILAKCSNSSSDEFQTALLTNGKPLYLNIVEKCEEFSRFNNSRCQFGYVVGSSCLEEMKKIREFCDAYFLVPGIGAQGGDLEKSIKYGIFYPY